MFENILCIQMHVQNLIIQSIISYSITIVIGKGEVNNTSNLSFGGRQEDHCAGLVSKTQIEN